MSDLFNRENTKWIPVVGLVIEFPYLFRDPASGDSETDASIYLSDTLRKQGFVLYHFVASIGLPLAGYQIYDGLQKLF